MLLALIGMSLLLGLFTQTGCAGALVMLSIFYVSAIPLGLPETRAEGSYLIVNKNLIELASVLVVFALPNRPYRRPRRVAVAVASRRAAA